MGGRGKAEVGTVMGQVEAATGLEAAATQEVRAMAESSRAVKEADA